MRLNVLLPPLGYNVVKVCNQKHLKLKFKLFLRQVHLLVLYIPNGDTSLILEKELEFLVDLMFKQNG